MGTIKATSWADFARQVTEATAQGRPVTLRTDGSLTADVGEPAGESSLESALGRLEKEGNGSPAPEGGANVG